ncbi:hypothetical protein GSI_08837 [Ganoderma sinense ZZ0214-1]|uniref:Retrotransposon Copia-like N-terminal domain-containing protein n=1 Tax=Ganoderma sinense ZZ0214-1 TaxID=1077348 RepID=A0A2G8S4T9_9APHY|nr:hypothetical protein GSI_08837 [Ganoderma sinense ZZ0214-1]
MTGTRPPTPTNTQPATTMPATATSSHPRVWELPSGINTLVPTQALRNEEDYRGWASEMKGALEYATVWKIVSSTETAPSAQDTDALELWQHKDGAARSMINRAMDRSIAQMVDGLKTAHEYWTTLETQFSRTSLNSAVSWFRSLVTPLSSIHQLEVHIKSFQVAVYMSVPHPAICHRYSTYSSADRVSSRTSPTLVTYTRTRSLDTPSLALTFPRAVLRFSRVHYRYTLL